METIKDSRKTQYTNDLNNVEAQITKDETKNLVKKEWNINHEFCGKLCITISYTLLVSPFAICDIYFANTDVSCINESQSSHNLTITLQSYLLASGIIMFTSIGVINFCLFALDLNLFKPNSDNDEFYCILYFLSLISNLFGTAWLILGCVLFWAYTNVEMCSIKVHDYLFARFIIFLFFNASKIVINNDKKN